VPRYLVVNADESEPGTFKDRYLMERIPHLLIEGMITSSFALGANTSYIYIRGEYFYVARILEQAIAEARAAGWLGKNILGSGFDHEYPRAGGCGRLHLRGGDRAARKPRRQTRQPAHQAALPGGERPLRLPHRGEQRGDHRAVVPIVNDGGEEYAKIGIGKSTGTKLISAGGNINKPGRVRDRTGRDLR
jgi:NADH-quinone oxidoreductase subunit F